MAGAWCRHVLRADFGDFVCWNTLKSMRVRCVHCLGRMARTWSPRMADYFEHVWDGFNMLNRFPYLCFAVRLRCFALSYISSEPVAGVLVCTIDVQDRQQLMDNVFV